MQKKEQKKALQENVLGEAQFLEKREGFSKQDKKTDNSELNLIRRYVIIGERRLSHYWWTFIVFLGSCGFLAVGLSSYYAQFLTGRTEDIPLNRDISPFFLLSGPFLNGKDISFFPQGLCLSFYGGLGFLLSLYWLFLILWNVGGGCNEFNKKKGLLRIFRWGYPGKTRRIDLSYSLKDIEAITVEVKQGIDDQRTIYLKLKEKRKIPITGIGEPLTFKEIEKQASELAHFLDVCILS